MFDIGFLELVLVSVIGLMVLGPERLPGAIRTVSLYVGKLRRSFNGIRAEIERELKADEIRQELHNQSVMQELRQTGKELREGMGLDGAFPGEGDYPIENDQSGEPPSTPDDSPGDRPPGQSGKP